MEASNVIKAMRDALEALVGVIDKCDSGDPLWWHIGAKGVKPLKDARAALAAPLRNCDVGTVEEQAERFRRFCGAHKPDEHQFTEYGELLCPSIGCELIACNYGQCALAWAQMQYKEVKE